MKTKRMYSKNNRCPATNDYDPNTINPYGSKWEIRYDEKTGNVTSAKLIESNVTITDAIAEKIKDNHYVIAEIRGY